MPSQSMGSFCSKSSDGGSRFRSSTTRSAMDDGKMAEPEMDPLQHIGGGIYRAIGQRSRFKSIMARGENFGDEILDLFWEETAPLMEGITFLARARKGAPVLASPGARERGD